MVQAEPLLSARDADAAPLLPRVGAWPWAATGYACQLCAFPRAGDLLLDFSSKGGPKDVLARADSIGITFPDGNVWKKQL